jgi:integrase
MARTLRDDKIGTRESRLKLKARGKPYYRAVEEGLHLGYRKPRGRKGKPAVAGKWVLRRYVGQQEYVVVAIAIADDFSDADGKTILDFAQAQNKARALLAGGRKSGPFTVRMALDAYFEKIEGGGRSAYDSRRRIEPFVHKIAGVKCDELEADQLRTWLRTTARAPARLRTAKGHKQKHRDFDHNDAEAVRQRQATANRTLAVLKAALNSAYRDGKIASAASWERVEPFKQVDAARVRFLSRAEAQRFINATDPEFRPMVEAALATGCRYGELCRLEVQDFSAHTGTIAIRRSKSGKARHVVLTENGVKLFQRLTAGRAGTDPVLCNGAGSPWTKSAQARPTIAACSHAHIKPRISFHILRHTWASLAIKNGLPLWMVARNLGHADTRMVEKHYGHVEQDFISDAIRKAAPQFDTEPTNVTAIA